MATRYWVGGSGNWSSTSQWSASSGGSIGASVPTSADDVIFDNNSGLSNYTATVDIDAVCASLSITPNPTIVLLKISITQSLSVSGNITTSGTAGNCRILFTGTTSGLQTNLSCGGTATLSDCDFRDVRVTGAGAPFSGTRIGNLQGVTGVNFSTPKTVYWVGLAGNNWATNSWAASSGAGASTDNFPLAQDTAVIDNAGLNSGATITIPNSAGYITYLGTIDMSTRTNPMTFLYGLDINVYGNWKNGTGTTISAVSSTIIFSSRTSQTITSSGVSFTCPVSIASFGGSVNLNDAFSVGSNALQVLDGATFNTNGYNVTALTFTSGGSFPLFQTLNLGSSTLTITGSASTFNATINANTVINGASATFNLSSTNGGIFIGLNCSGTINNVNYSSGTVGTICSLSSSLPTNVTINNITVTPPSTDGYVLLRLFNIFGPTIGTLTVAGASPTRRIFVNSIYTTAVITAPYILNVNSLSANDCDFRDITITGSAVGTAPTRAGNCGNVTGITFPAPKTVYWNLAGSQNWSANGWAGLSGGSPSSTNFPLPQDTAVFDNLGAAGTITFDVAWNVGTIDMSGRTSAMTLSNGTVGCSVYGDWKFGTGVTSAASTASTVFIGRSTQTITSNGVTFNTPINISSGYSTASVSGAKSTVQLGDALIIASDKTFTLRNGAFDAKTYNVTTGTFVATGNTFNPRDLYMGSGLWTLSGTGTVWNIQTGGLTFYKQTANITVSNTSTTARTFAGASLPYNKLTIGGTTGTSTFTITGSNWFSELASTKTVAHTIALGTTAQTFGAWTVTGTVGNVVTLTGTGTSHVLAGACTSGIDYLAMGSIGFASTSCGEFYAGANSTGTAGAPVYRTAKPADGTRYWVGGTGNWSDTNRWSTTSGSGSGAAVPRSHDDVIFDSGSNATAYTATVDAVTGGIRMKSLTIAGPASGNVTLAGSAAMVGIHGNVTLPATGLTRTYTGAITLSGSTTGKTINTNGVALASGITVNGVGCEWTLASNLDIGINNLTVTAGSIKFSTYNFTAAQLLVSSIQTTKSIDLGSSTVTLSEGLGTAALSLGTINNGLTFTAGTSQINFTADAVIVSGGGNATFYNVSFTSTSGTSVDFNSAFNYTFNNLSITGRTSTGIKYLSFEGTTITINGTFTCSAGTDATCRVVILPARIGTKLNSAATTISCAAVSLTDVDFVGITMTGAAAPVSGTRLGDAKGNTGITFGAGVNKYWNLAAGGNWSSTGWALSSGGGVSANNFPLAQDTAIIEATGLNSGATITVDNFWYVGGLDMSARNVSNPMTFSSSSPFFSYLLFTKDFVCGAGVTFNALLGNFIGRGLQTVTTNGAALLSSNAAITIASINGTVRLLDDFNNSGGGVITIAAGTFDTNGKNVTAGRISSTSTSWEVPRALATGNSIITLTASGTGTLGPLYIVSSLSTNLRSTSTLMTTTGYPTFKFTGTTSKEITLPSASGNIFNCDGFTLDQAGSGEMVIVSAYTLYNITNSYKSTGASSIKVNSTDVIKLKTFSLSGEASRLCTLYSSSASSPASFYLDGANKVNVNYLNLSATRVAPCANTWYAGPNSVNGTLGNLGWTFQTAPQGGFMMML